MEMREMNAILETKTTGHTMSIVTNGGWKVALYNLDGKGLASKWYPIETPDIDIIKDWLFNTSQKS
jgi:hypothetical protein